MAVAVTAVVIAAVVIAAVVMMVTVSPAAVHPQVTVCVALVMVGWQCASDFDAIESCRRFLSYGRASVAGVDEVRDRLAVAARDLAEAPVFGLSSDGIVADLELLTVVNTQLAVAAAQRVRELEGRNYARREGASSMTAWLRDRLRISAPAAKRMVALGKLIDARPAIEAALVNGGCNTEQALVIGEALEDLAAGFDDRDDPAVVAALKDKAETILLDDARMFDPKPLATLGRRIVDHIAPELADEALQRHLDRDEVRARVGRSLTLSRLTGSRWRLSGYLDTESAAMVSAAMEPFCVPQPGTDGPDMRSAAQRRADALVEVCRRAVTPAVGAARADREANAAGGADAVGRANVSSGAPGKAVQVTVTIDYESLRRQLGAGRVDTGDLVSPTTVRRLACDAKIIPAVLGGDGAVLDVGAARRLFTGALRQALILRDRGCAFPGCDRPPSWCDAHHIRSWVDGGPTSLDNGVLLCGHHHRLIHEGAWAVRLGLDRFPEFIPPAYVDSHRTPRRNHHHGGGSGRGSAKGPARDG
jgi:Domain of unknown function (DUF222)/HNH endonuclease